jgi:hypothetical protein
MLPAGFELVITARYRPQNLAFDRSATGIGWTIKLPEQNAVIT